MSSDSPLPAVYVAGLNQSKKHIKAGTAAKAFIAGDADSRLLSLVESLCSEYAVPCDRTHTKEELGAMCGIEVDCAVCVVLR